MTARDQYRQRLAAEQTLRVSEARGLLDALDRAEADADRLDAILAVCTVAGPRPDIGRLEDERKAARAAHDEAVAQR